MAAFSIVNRELKNINEIKLLNTSPIGWMNTQHTDSNNTLTPSSGCYSNANQNICNYNFKRFIEGSSVDMQQVRLSAESNKIWLFGNG